MAHHGEHLISGAHQPGRPGLTVLSELAPAIVPLKPLVAFLKSSNLVLQILLLSSDSSHLALGVVDSAAHPSQRSKRPTVLLSPRAVWIPIANSKDATSRAKPARAGC